MEEKINNIKIEKNPRYKTIFNNEELILPDNYSLKNKRKEFTVIFDGMVEEDNRGEIIQSISIADGDSAVGYLRVKSYPESSKEILYPNILNWMENFRGDKLGLSRHPRDIDSNKSSLWEYKTQEEKLKTISAFYKKNDRDTFEEIEELKLEGIDKIDCDKIYTDMIDLATEKYGDVFDKFKNNNESVNVEYSLIRSGQQIEGKAINGESMRIQSERMKEYCDSIGTTTKEYCTPNENDYTRQGLATKMYKIMSDYLAINNKVLVKGITNDFSNPLWEKKIQNNTDFGFTYSEDKEFEMIDNRKMDTSYLLKQDDKDNQHKIENPKSNIKIKKI
jgi:hypothetical protein